MITVSTVTSAYGGERYLAGFLESVASQTILRQVEVVLVHNEPTASELSWVRDFQMDYPENLKHIVVEPVEPLASSMNRCVRAAQADYLTIWNVDDLRTPDSIERQRAVLDSDSTLIATYGDYDVVRRFGSREGRRDTYPQYDSYRFTRGMYGSCFLMWRKSLARRAGLFDEQLMQGADYDFFLRLAFNGPMKKTEGLLGWYLNEGRGLASRPNTLQPLERTVIELRYGIYGTIDYGYWRHARRYDLDRLLFDHRWHSVSEFVPDFAKMKRRRRREIPGGAIRHVAQNLLRPRARAIRDRFKASATQDGTPAGS